MSLRNLEQKNILTNKESSDRLSFGKKISLAIGAFVLSTNLALAEPNKTISMVDFMEGGTAELYKDKNGAYGIRNGNSKNGSDFIYGTTIINGKKYIVYSSSYDYEIEVFLETDLDLYKEYLSKYGEERAYKLIKAREQYLENFLKDNPLSDFDSEAERLEKAL
ncbi:hypothetical protein HUU51_02990 [Candidatus Gracilibacteria bacterium]|nr:hypothetical protein [Candidatus Gracilibacteria bacterium]